MPGAISENDGQLMEKPPTQYNAVLKYHNVKAQWKWAQGLRNIDSSQKRRLQVQVMFDPLATHTCVQVSGESREFGERVIADTAISYRLLARALAQMESFGRFLCPCIAPVLDSIT